MSLFSRRGVCALTLFSCVPVEAINLDASNADSIKDAALIISKGLLSYYHPGDSGSALGIFPSPYFWWTSGAVWGGLIDYWHYTGDAQYNDIVGQALLSQAGPNLDYMPTNQTRIETNDDQAFWALAAMTAAERQLRNPKTSLTWLSLAQNVFDAQVARWDTSTCGGGLRWQIFTFNTGYRYKNSISTGAFFQLAARLARYTGNQTYVDWAQKSWDWVNQVSLLDENYHVFDGTEVDRNCSQISHIRWSYTAGTFLAGSAYMFNSTNGDGLWQNRTQSLLSAMSIFFTSNNSIDPSVSSVPPGILYESACETHGSCGIDQVFFKGLTARFMASTMQLAPFTANYIASLLHTSAQGAAKQCSGSYNGTVCGYKWTEDTWDGMFGLAEQMNALDVVQAGLVLKSQPPVTAKTTSCITPVNNGPAGNGTVSTALTSSGTSTSG